MRRAAALHVLEAWRAIARDLALASRGATAELRQRELIDELLAATADVDAARLGSFLERLDGAARAIDAYANPELMLDALLIEWPRPTAAGQRAGQAA